MMALEYRVLPPRKQTENPPALVMLHGYGADMNDLYSFATMLPEELLIISVQAPRRLPWGGYAWYDIEMSADGIKTSNAQQGKEAVQQVFTFLDEMREEFDFDANRLFLLGFSQGCILSLACMYRQPERFKGIVALSGYLNVDFLDQKPEDVTISGAVFHSHGTQDPVIPVSAAEMTRDILEKTDLDYTFKTYPAGHGINQENLQDLIAWINTKLNS